MTPRFAVSDFLLVTNQALESFGSVEIEGEVASFAVNQQKYVFFDLKDDEGTVSCFMMAWQLRRPIEDGMQVVVRATPKVTQRGKFSITVQEVTPRGEGAMQRSFAMLKQRLANEGLFAFERKRSLPARPTRVGVVSSVQSAGYADFMKIATERWGGVHFIVAHTQVQGDGAAERMAQALERLQQLPEEPEVIVLLRGGGSADDLRAFDDERLVRAVAMSRVPILTGIGHETDESLCDLAADRRASTPSNAAQLLLPDKHAVSRQLMAERRGVITVLQRAIEQRQSELSLRLREARAVVWAALERGREALLARQAVVAELDPELALRRGYAVVRGGDHVGDMVKITTSKALIEARIERYEAR